MHLRALCDASRYDHGQRFQLRAPAVREREAAARDLRRRDSGRSRRDRASRSAPHPISLARAGSARYPRRRAADGAHRDQCPHHVDPGRSRAEPDRARERANPVPHDALPSQELLLDRSLQRAREADSARGAHHFDCARGRGGRNHRDHDRGGTDSPGRSRDGARARVELVLRHHLSCRRGEPRGPGPRRDGYRGDSQARLRRGRSGRGRRLRRFSKDSKRLPRRLNLRRRSLRRSRSERASSPHRRAPQAPQGIPLASRRSSRERRGFRGSHPSPREQAGAACARARRPARGARLEAEGAPLRSRSRKPSSRATQMPSVVSGTRWSRSAPPA